MERLAHPTIFLAITTFPLYLLPSGGPQLSHAFLALFMLAFHRKLLNYRRWIPRAQRSIFRTMLMFVAIVFFVQIGAAMAYGEAEFLVYAAFYVFNLLYLYSAFAYLKVYPLRGPLWVHAGVVAATVIAFAGIALGVTTGSQRSTGFFNNPNQLGYFGVAAIALLLTLQAAQESLPRRTISIAALGLAFYLCLASLSKAAMVASVISIMLFLPTFRRREILAMALAGLILSPLLIEKVQESDRYSSAVARLRAIGEDHDDNLSSRGYDRILHYPQYLFAGAGEGYFARFGSSIEIHSTFANLLFSYGIIGFGVFLYWWLQTFRLAPGLFMVTFAGAFLYGLTHNGIRSSYFWLLIAVFLFSADRLRLAQHWGRWRRRQRRRNRLVRRNEWRSSRDAAISSQRSVVPVGPIVPSARIPGEAENPRNPGPNGSGRVL